MANRVCEALGIKYPVIQGPMAWTSLPPLVAAVSNAGGLGVLGSGAMPGDIIKQMAEGIRAMTDNEQHSGTGHFEENCDKAAAIARDVTLALLGELAGEV